MSVPDTCLPQYSVHYLRLAAARKGVPEVILADRKRPEDTLAAVQAFLDARGRAIVTAPPIRSWTSSEQRIRTAPFRCTAVEVWS